MARLTLKDWEVGEDLRYWGWSADKVAEVQKKYKLKEGEYVAIFNNAKEFGGSGSHTPKVRLYGMLPGGQVFTLIPPVADGREQYDFQHEFNKWMRRFLAGASDIGAIDDYDKAYIERRKKAAEAAKRREAA